MLGTGPGCGPGRGRGCSPGRTVLNDAIEVGAADPDAAADVIGGQRSIVDPIADGLLIELQQLGDLSDCQELIHVRRLVQARDAQLEFAAELSAETFGRTER
jgi:hypothetical protein